MDITSMPDHPVKVSVVIVRRSDGGLQVSSDDVPGLVLSHSDPDRVIADIEPALETIIKEMVGTTVKVSYLPGSGDEAERPSADVVPIDGVSWHYLAKAA